VTGPGAKPVSFAITLRNQNQKEPARFDRATPPPTCAGNSTVIAPFNPDSHRR